MLKSTVCNDPLKEQLCNIYVVWIQKDIFIYYNISKIQFLRDIWLTIYTFITLYLDYWVRGWLMDHFYSIQRGPTIYNQILPQIKILNIKYQSVFSPSLLCNLSFFFFIFIILTLLDFHAKSFYFWKILIIDRTYLH